MRRRRSTSEASAASAAKGLQGSVRCPATGPARPASAGPLRGAPRRPVEAGQRSRPCASGSKAHRRRMNAGRCGQLPKASSAPSVSAAAGPSPPKLRLSARHRRGRARPERRNWIAHGAPPPRGDLRGRTPPSAATSAMNAEIARAALMPSASWARRTSFCEHRVSRWARRPRCACPLRFTWHDAPVPVDPCHPSPVSLDRAASRGHIEPECADDALSTRSGVSRRARSRPRRAAARRPFPADVGLVERRCTRRRPPSLSTFAAAAAPVAVLGQASMT
jgi:hypothetical protein